MVECLSRPVEQPGELHQAAQELVVALFRNRISRLFLVSRIVQHTRTQASGIIVPREHIEIDAA